VPLTKPLAQRPFFYTFVQCAEITWPLTFQNSRICLHETAVHFTSREQEAQFEKTMDIAVAEPTIATPSTLQECVAIVHSTQYSYTSRMSKIRAAFDSKSALALEMHTKGNSLFHIVLASAQMTGAVAKSTDALLLDILAANTAVVLQDWHPGFSLLRFLVTHFPDSVALVSAVLRANPLGIRERDKFVRTLLHDAMRFCRNIDVTLVVCKHWPEALVLQNSDGNTPLHICTFELIASVPSAYVQIHAAAGAELFKEAAAIRNQWGNIPLAEVLHKQVICLAMRRAHTFDRHYSPPPAWLDSLLCLFCANPEVSACRALAQYATRLPPMLEPHQEVLVHAIRTHAFARRVPALRAWDAARRPSSHVDAQETC